METRTKLVACEYNELGYCVNAIVVRNLTTTEYNKLVNESNIEKAKAKELQDNILKDLAGLHLAQKNIIFFLAKGVYDNMVDRGLIDEDKEFETKWHEFIINGTPIDKLPLMISTIIERLGA